MAFAVGSRGKFPRKSISFNLFGGAAVACLVMGCGWTVYTNVIAASVYPTLGSAGYDEPVSKPSPQIAVRNGADAIREAFSALPMQASAAKLAAAPSITPRMFDERFAAAEPDGVASRAAEAAPPPAAPKLAEAPKAAPAARLADAAKPKDAAPARLALNVPPPPSRPADAKPANSAANSFRDMAQRAKAAVMSLATGERTSITEKLWGKEPSSRGSLLSYASADANVTGSIGREPNPMLGGQPPYDRDTAVYDISAHMVYLPDGTRLEAHSGLGSELDNPRSASIRMRGVTPPHIYELKPREALFHGVPALRLNPIGGEESIFGRSGLLAHTYMLGPNGDSNGCVSFKDYNAFLNAYRNQGIKKLAVVARID
jgi:Tlde1 domain